MDKLKKPAFGNNFQYCMDLVEKNDLEGFLSASLLNKKQFTMAIILRCLMLEASNLLNDLQKHKINSTLPVTDFQFTFWTNALQDIGKQNVVLPRQPVILAISKMAELCQLQDDLHLIVDLFKIRKLIGQQSPFQNFEDVQTYANIAFGNYFRLVLKLSDSETSGISLSDELDIVRNAAFCLFYANILRSMSFYAMYDRIIIPVDQFKQHQLRHLDFMNNTNPEKSIALIEDMCHQCSVLYKKTIDSIGKLPKREQAVFAPLAVVPPVISTVLQNKQQWQKVYFKAAITKPFFNIKLRQLNPFCRRLFK